MIGGLGLNHLAVEIQKSISKVIYGVRSFCTSSWVEL